MKILTVVGARPQFIKAAALSRILESKIEEIIVHTGQHYDNNMSDVFFSELQIPKPNYMLAVGSGNHGKQTGQMLMDIEEVILKEKPDCLLVYGDTNSTLAGALAASKLLIPVIHVEAGLRSYNKEMPEEQNRVLTDHLSSLLFCPTETAVNNLVKENIIENVYNVGDVMCDAVLFYEKELVNIDKKTFFSGLVGLFSEVETLENWYLATIHRAENTRDNAALSEILQTFEALKHPVIFPVHPRIKKMAEELNALNKYTNIYFIEPVGYLEMLYLTKGAEKVITDSGGLQKEAFILGTPCVTVRDQTEWVETLIGNHNVLSKPNKESILGLVNNTNISEEKSNYYGDGRASEKILNIILNTFKN